MTPLPGRRPAERCGTVRMLSDGSRDRQAPSTKVSETTSCTASTGIADVGRRRRQMKAAVHTPADATAGGTIAGRAALVRAGPREKTVLAAPTCGPQRVENAAITVSTPTAT